MKKVLILFVIMSLASGCSVESMKAQRTAEGFLDAFFQMDYQKAGSYCAGDLSEDIAETINDIEMPSEEMESLVREASVNTTYEITGVDTKSEKGVASVYYNIIPYGSEASIERSMILIKEGGKWLILQLL